MQVISQLFHAMAEFEGYYKKGPKLTVAQRNNNPLNLRFAGQTGATLGPDDFAVFSTPGAGIAAGYRQLAKWIQEGMTLEELVTRHAPPNENATDRYISFVRSRLATNGINVLGPGPGLPAKPLLHYLT